ncbi:MAG: hypothetical protein ABI821_14870 [Pseudomonadota bacterium]
MIRREYPIFAIGLGTGIAATVWAGQVRQPQVLASGVYAWGSLPVEMTASGERRQVFDSATVNAGDPQASYFVLHWTTPGKVGPKPGGSK